MIYFIALLGICCIVIGAIVLGEQEARLRIRPIEGDAPTQLSASERLVSGLVFIFVGALLALTAGSTIWTNDPYWFMDTILAIFL